MSTQPTKTELILIKPRDLQTGDIFRYASSQKPYYATRFDDIPEPGKPFIRVYSVGTQSPVQVFDHFKALTPEYNEKKDFILLHRPAKSHIGNVGKYPEGYQNLVGLALKDEAEKRIEVNAIKTRAAKAAPVEEKPAPKKRTTKRKSAAKA